MQKRLFCIHVDVTSLQKEQEHCCSLIMSLEE
jgi:hypothetical protein